MRKRLSLPVGFLLFVLAYMASPYVALWRLEAALEGGDVQGLERKIDWHSVRESLKQDISDGIIGPAQAQAASNTLPPFGASFVTGIADNAVDREVSPQNLVEMMHQMRSEPASGSTGSPLGNFAWAFFESPMSFTVIVRTGDEDGQDGHLRLRLVLRQTGWTLVRAWIPQDLIERAGQRT